MKTIEQKAKAYDEALERAKKQLDGAKVFDYKEKQIAHDIRATTYAIFPELKEPDDEKIRKELISYFKQFANEELRGVNIHDWITWLEKQGQKETTYDEDMLGAIEYCKKNNRPLEKEHIAWLEKKGEKPQGKSAQEAVKEEKADNANKVEPKFKVGDYVVDNCGYLWRVEGVINQFYILEGIDGGESRPTIEWVNKTFHLWDITKDAKDGDVLAVDNMIFIYERALASHIVSYCKLINDIFEPFDDARTCCEGNPYVHPATKEQREQLEKAMADAGYTFDFDKKELKKIEHDVQLTEFEKSVKHVMEEAIECGDTHNLKADADMLLRLAQKPAWSEEDEYNFAFIQEALLGLDGDDSYREKCRKMVEWLESLRPQNTWKPSDEQMYNLRWVGNVLLSHHDSIVEKDSAEKLNSLYEDLKKLKE